MEAAHNIICKGLINVLIKYNSIKIMKCLILVLIYCIGCLSIRNSSRKRGVSLVASGIR